MGSANQKVALKPEIANGTGYIAKLEINEQSASEIAAQDIAFLDNTKSFTLSFFYKVEQPKNQADWFILFARDAGTYHGKTLTIGYYKEDIWVYTTYGYVRDFNRWLQYGKKSQLTLVLRPAEIELFIDGESIGSQLKDWIWTNKQPFRFGSCGNYKPPQGTLEEIYFYGTALSAQQIQQNYQAQKQQLGIEDEENVEN